MRFIAACLLTVCFLSSYSDRAAAEEKVGVVLMHGKRGNPGSGSLIGSLEAALRAAGIRVVAPEMPWSRQRFLDKTFDGIVAEIDQAAAALRKDGVRKIIVGGHSLGGNAALAYGARREGLAGILVIAPGHFPESKGFRKRFDADLGKARSMVDSGKGGETGSFGDIDQGVSDSYSMTAKAYVDFMDPDGPLAMPNSAASLKPNMPLMLIIGQEDPVFSYGRGEQDYIFDKAPAHPKSVYKVVPGGHKATPRVGTDEIIAWLKSL
jgi:pimeloyl-ACP methyl ester carboxylesterase